MSYMSMMRVWMYMPGPVAQFLQVKAKWQSDMEKQWNMWSRMTQGYKLAHPIRRTHLSVFSRYHEYWCSLWLAKTKLALEISTFLEQGPAMSWVATSFIAISGARDGTCSHQFSILQLTCIHVYYCAANQHHKNAQWQLMKPTCSPCSPCSPVVRT